MRYINSLLLTYLLTYYMSNNSLDKAERCFDIVAVYGNNVERNFVFSTQSKQTEHVPFVSTLSKGRNFVINSFDVAAVLATKSNVASTKSNVASTLFLVWTGLNIDEDDCSDGD